MHEGAKEFEGLGSERYNSLLRKISRTPKARLGILGDLTNVATRESKSSPFEQTCSLDEQIERQVKALKKVKNQIVFGSPGNHENRTADHAGFDPLRRILAELGREDAYSAYSAYVDLTVKCRGIGRQDYRIYGHHTTGGGRSAGAALNRVYMLRELADADIYCGGHSHRLVFSQEPIVRTGGEFRLQTYVVCGAWMTWDGSYAEKGMLRPARIGSPVIRLQAAEWRVGVSV